jgi:hypothetical protein
VRTLCENLPCPLDRPLTNVEELSDFGIRQAAIWRLAPVAAVSERRQLGRDHCTLACVQVATVEIDTEDEADGIVAGWPWLLRYLRAGCGG